MPAVDLPKSYIAHLERHGFDLQEVAGQGLCGSVYIALQRSLNRRVAVKFFDSAFVRSDLEMKKRFSREAKLLARFQHPNLPYVLTEGIVEAEHGATPYFVMEYVAGASLQKLLETKSRPDQQTAIDLTRQILSALQYAHQSAIIHRDIKPSNLMVDGRGRCFVIDFSIGVNFAPGKGETRVTKAGAILGTPPYAAPEQLADACRADHRSDIYSVGVVLLEMLAGRPDVANISKSLAGLPRGVSSAIEIACANDPEARYGAADEFARALGSTAYGLSPAPALAICRNLMCSSANWSSRGYYRGPRIIPDSTSSFCTSCGEQLCYDCEKCGHPIAETPSCGNCGNETFRIPECKKCGSWLTKEFVLTNGEQGCRKCQKTPPSATTEPPTDFDDDIPF